MTSLPGAPGGFGPKEPARRQAPARARNRQSRHSEHGFSDLPRSRSSASAPRATRRRQAGM